MPTPEDLALNNYISCINFYLLTFLNPNQITSGDTVTKQPLTDEINKKYAKHHGLARVINILPDNEEIVRTVQVSDRNNRVGPRGAAINDKVGTTEKLTVGIQTLQVILPMEN